MTDSLFLCRVPETIEDLKLELDFGSFWFGSRAAIHTSMCLVSMQQCTGFRSVGVKLGGSYLCRHFWHDSKRAKKMSHRPDHVQLTANQTRTPQIMDAKIATIQRLSPTIKAFTLDVSQPESGFKAGQWVDFMVPGIEKVGGFSMTSSPQKLVKDSQLALAIKSSLCEPAHWLHERAQIGDPVQMRVGGDFYYPHPKSVEMLDHHRLLLIGGGVGINPLLSILKHVQEVKESSRPDQVNLLYSAQNLEELIFEADILSMSSKSGFNVNFFVTDPKEALIPSNYNHRRISKTDLDQIIQGKPDQYLAYICGPNSMIKDMEEALLSLAVPKSQIFFESWW